MQNIEHGNEARTDGQTELFLNEIIPLAIPYHSSPIPVSMQGLKKIGKKVLQTFIEIRLFILKVLTKNAFWT